MILEPLMRYSLVTILSHILLESTQYKPMNRLSTPHITILAFISSILITLLFSWGMNLLFHDNPPDEFLLLAAAIFLTILGSPGFVYISRKEFPSQGYTLVYKGKLAVIGGIVWLLLFYSPTIIILFSLLRDFFSR